MKTAFSDHVTIWDQDLPVAPAISFPTPILLSKPLADMQGRCFADLISIALCVAFSCTGKPP